METGLYRVISLCLESASDNRRAVQALGRRQGLTVEYSQCHTNYVGNETDITEN